MHSCISCDQRSDNGFYYVNGDYWCKVCHKSTETKALELLELLMVRLNVHTKLDSWVYPNKEKTIDLMSDVERFLNEVKGTK